MQVLHLALFNLHLSQYYFLQYKHNFFLLAFNKLVDWLIFFVFKIILAIKLTFCLTQNFSCLRFLSSLSSFENDLSLFVYWFKIVKYIEKSNFNLLSSFKKTIYLMLKIILINIAQISLALFPYFSIYLHWL